jgi:HSP20 family protein
MTKEKVILIIGVLLLIALSIQSYSIYQLNNRVIELSSPNLAPSISSISKNLELKPASPNDKFFKQLPWNPYKEMQEMQQEMEQLFNDSYSRFHINAPLESLNKIPDVDLQEKSDQYIVTMNAPGADISSLTVNLDDRLLNIAIKTEHTEDNKTDDQKGQYQFRERFVGELQRSLTLPGPADATKIATEYHNGLLTIIIPKK